MMDDDFMDLEIRYNGSFKHIKRSKTVIYEGGKSTTFRVEVDRTCLKDVLDDLRVFRHAIERQIIRLAYVVPQSAPEKFVFINTDAEYMEMLGLHKAKRKCVLYEIVEYRGLPIRFFYNPQKMKRKLLQQDRDVVIPHFVLEDEIWQTLLYGNTTSPPDHQEEAIQHSPAHHEEATEDQTNNHIEDSQSSTALQGEATQGSPPAIHSSSAHQVDHEDYGKVENISGKNTPMKRMPIADHVEEDSTPSRTLRQTRALREEAQHQQATCSPKQEDEDDLCRRWWICTY